MKWICVLHFYQPPFQKPRILDQIVNECYLPLTQMLIEKRGNYSLYLNINLSLLEQLIDNNHLVVIENIKELVEVKRVRLTLTPAFHPIIPLLSSKIIIDQVDQNKKAIVDRFNFGKYDLFFPPELAFNPESNLINDTVLVSQSALSNDIYTPLVKYKGKKYVIRHKDLSNIIMGGEIKSFQRYNIENLISNNEYFVTAVDGETFGHHRKGYIKVLDNLISEMETCWVPNNDKLYQQVEELQASSWSSVLGQSPFLLWNNKDNKIHKLLWRLVELVGEEVKTNSNRLSFYRALSSCTFWWASANPWWSIEMVERGAWLMYKAVPAKSTKTKRMAHKIYIDIVLLALKWQREGVIDSNFKKDLTKNTPFSKRCKKGELEDYIKKFQEAEQLAVVEKNYELAIRWRDAAIKLKNNIDQYDDWHVVDQLRGYDDVPVPKL